MRAAQDTLASHLFLPPPTNGDKCMPIRLSSVNLLVHTIADGFRIWTLHEQHCASRRLGSMQMRRRAAPYIIARRSQAAPPQNLFQSEALTMACEGNLPCVFACTEWHCHHTRPGMVWPITCALSDVAAFLRTHQRRIVRTGPSSLVKPTLTVSSAVGTEQGRLCQVQDGFFAQVARSRLRFACR